MLIYYYGLNIVVNYKNFDFIIFGQGSGGNFINSNFYWGLMVIFGYINWYEDILNCWIFFNINMDVLCVVLNDLNNNQWDLDCLGWL